MIPYVENFYSHADELFEFIKGLPFVRPDNKRNRTSRLRRLSFPGYSPPLSGHHRSSRYSVSGTVDDAPEPYKRLADAITAYQVSQGLPNPCNYLSTIGYLTDDHMNFHQHREDKKRKDQTVYVLSLGAVHPVAIRSGYTGPKRNGKRGTEFIPDGKDDYVIYPKHGSLYVLPDSFNRPGSGNEHQHAVLDGDDYSHGGLRIAINCKHIPAGLSDDEMRKACSRPAGAPHEKKSKPAWIHPTLGLKVWCCRKGYETPPDDAVLVDRTTPYGNKLYLKNEADFRAYAEQVLAPNREIFLEPLRGKDLICWCDPKEPWCHARVWLELANAVKP